MGRGDQRRQGEERGPFSPGAQLRDVMLGDGDLAGRGAVHLVANDPAAHVVEIVGVDVVADDLVAGQKVVGLGEDDAPVGGVGVGVCRVQGEDSILRRVEVGQQPEFVLDEARTKAGRGVDDDRMWLERGDDDRPGLTGGYRHRPALGSPGQPDIGRHVLQIHIRPGPAVLDGEHHVAPLPAFREADELLRPVTFAEELGIVLDVRPQHVEAHAAADFTRPADVVEAGPVPVEGDSAVEKVGQPVRQVFAGLQVAHPDLHLVLAAVAHCVDHEVAVGEKSRMLTLVVPVGSRSRGSRTTSKSPPGSIGSR